MWAYKLQVTIADLYSNGPLPYVPVLQSDLPASPFQLDLTYDCDADSVTLIFCSDNVASKEDTVRVHAENVTIADLYSNGPLPYVPVLQSDLPASPFQLDLTYDCDADSVTLIFCSDNVASKEDARASHNCYVAAPIRIRTNTNDGQGYFGIILSQDASLSIHESSTNLDFGLLKRLYAYTTGGTSCNIQFTVQERTELTDDESANGDNVQSDTELEKEPTKDPENVENDESSPEDQADGSNVNPSNNDDDQAGNPGSVDDGESSPEDQADGSNVNPSTNDDDPAGNPGSVDDGESSPEDQADGSNVNPSNNDDDPAGNPGSVDDGESSPEDYADGSNANPSNNDDDPAGNPGSVDDGESSPEDQADGSNVNPSNNDDDPAGNPGSVDDGESSPEDQADGSNVNPSNNDDDPAGNPGSVDDGESSPEDQADGSNVNPSNNDDDQAGNPGSVDDGESSPEDQADGSNVNPSNNDDDPAGNPESVDDGESSPEDQADGSNVNPSNNDDDPAGNPGSVDDGESSPEDQADGSNANPSNNDDDPAGNPGSVDDGESSPEDQADGSNVNPSNNDDDPAGNPGSVDDGESSPEDQADGSNVNPSNNDDDPVGNPGSVVDGESSPEDHADGSNVNPSNNDDDPAGNPGSVDDGESSPEDQADGSNVNPSNNDDDQAGNPGSVDDGESSPEDQADGSNVNPSNNDDDPAGNPGSVDDGESSPEDQADGSNVNPSNNDDDQAGNPGSVDDGESSPEDQADGSNVNPSNNDDPAGNPGSVDDGESSPEDQADGSNVNPSNNDDDPAGNPGSVDDGESSPEDQADGSNVNPSNNDDDQAGNPGSVDDGESSPEDQADGSNVNPSNNDDDPAGNPGSVDDGESSPEDQADGSNANPSNNDLAVEDYPSVELQATGPKIPIYQADDSSDFSLNFIVPHESQSIQGLAFFLLPSTSSSEGEGYVIRFAAGSLYFNSPGDNTEIEYTYNIGNVPAGASLRLVVEGNNLYIRILQGETYINLVTALTIQRASIQAICVGATRVFYLRYYCGLLQWISQPSAPQLDDDTPKDYTRLAFVTDGSGDGVFNDNLKFNVLQTSRYDFLVQAQRGAVLYLSSSQDASSAVYRLVIGDGNDGNTISLYRASDATTPIAQADSPDVLNEFKYVRFSLTISRNPDTKVLTFLLDLRNFHSSSARRLLTFTDSVSYEQSSLYLGFNSVGEYRIYWICYLYFIRSGSSLAQGYTQTTGQGDRSIQVGPFPAEDRKLLMATNLQSDLVVEFLDSDEAVVVTISFGIDSNTKSVIIQNDVELASDPRGLELTTDNEEYAFAYIWISFSNGLFQAGYQFESSFISSDSCTGLSDIRFAKFRAGDGAPANVKYTNYYWRYFVETADGELVGRFNDISYRCHDMEEDAWGFSATLRVELPECWGGYVLFGSRSNPIGEME
eukprot:XP_011668326.1 PREDICTED: uncharacterized protein LOC105440166 [Strongylocentrotus purpuratus]